MPQSSRTSRSDQTAVAAARQRSSRREATSTRPPPPTPTPAADGTLGIIPELAYALLGHGRTLLALGRPEDARPALDRARTIFGTSGRAGPREIDAAILALDALPA